MRKVLIAIVALSCCALPACTVGGVNSPGSLAPSQIADATTVDETLRGSAERLYKLIRLTIEGLADTGMVKGANAAKLQTIDNQAFAALGVVRSGDKAINAKTVVDAANQLADLADQVAAVVKDIRK